MHPRANAASRAPYITLEAYSCLRMVASAFLVAFITVNMAFRAELLGIGVEGRVGERGVLI